MHKACRTQWPGKRGSCIYGHKTQTYRSLRLQQPIHNPFNGFMATKTTTAGNHFLDIFLSFVFNLKSSWHSFRHTIYRIYLFLDAGVFHNCHLRSLLPDICHMTWLFLFVIVAYHGKFYFTRLWVPATAGSRICCWSSASQSSRMLRPTLTHPGMK